MTNIWNSNFNVGDKVLYLGSETISYDKDGNELNVELNRGKIYTVKEVLILSIKIEEFDGIYLKTYFRTLEHKQPLNKGGLHSSTNIVMACLQCNCTKRDMTEEQFKNYKNE